MHILILITLITLIALPAAVRFRRAPARAPASSPQHPDAAPADLDLEAAAELLSQIAALLLQVMDHPALGGPGFLTIQIRPEESGAAVTAQFPNIGETLYRQIVRQELEPEALLEAGIPAGLLSLSPVFETESGGMVLLSVRAPALPLGPLPAGARDRSRLLGALAQALKRRQPRMAVRCLGWEILLSLEERGGAYSPDGEKGSSPSGA